MSSKGLKYLTKDSIKWLSISAGLELANLLRAFRPGEKTSGRGIIFTLHHVRRGDPVGFSPNGHLSVTPQFLETAIRAVQDEGYEIVRLRDVPEILKHEANRRFAVFTMDDGYHNNATEALPVFSRYQAPFTVFATRGLTLRTHTIWWETLEALTRSTESFEYDFGSGPARVFCRSKTEKAEIHERIARHIIGPEEEVAIERLNQAARQHGIAPGKIVENLVMDESELKTFSENALVSIGAHTVSHRAISYLPDDIARREMEESAEFVKSVTGTFPTTFAYPYGFRAAVRQRDHQLAADAGFSLAVTTQPGTLNTRSLDCMHALPRVSLNGLYQKERYVRALASGMPFGLMAQNHNHG